MCAGRNEQRSLRRMELNLSTPERAEHLRRSIVMLAPQTWALRREEAVHVLAVLLVALEELRRR